MKKFVIILASLIALILLTVPLVKASSKQTTAVASKTASSGEGKETKKTSEHEKAEEKTEKESKAEGEEEHGEEAEGEHGEEEGEHEEAAWKIPGWKSIFAILAIIYFGSALTLLPRYLADKSSGGHH